MDRSLTQGHVAVQAAFSPEFRLLWSAALGAALFYPVRQLIWVLSVRRVQRQTGEFPGEEARASMKRRAGVTSVLLCLVVAATFGGVMFGNPR